MFTLRNGRLAWQEDEGKGEPWNLNHLILYCCVDNRLWTAEGTEQVRQEKAEEITKLITNMKKKNIKEKNDLRQTQQDFIKRKESTLSKSAGKFISM